MLTEDYMDLIRRHRLIEEWLRANLISEYYFLGSRNNLRQAEVLVEYLMQIRAQAQRGA
jgi:hypothetical protein